MILFVNAVHNVRYDSLRVCDFINEPVKIVNNVRKIWICWRKQIQKIYNHFPQKMLPHSFKNM